jgi:hypothetical protein
MVSCSKFLVVSVFLFSLVSVSVPWVSAVDGDVMSLEVAEAEEALILAYDSVLEAEEAGANVSGLLDRLSVGGNYLAEAYAYVRLDDFENASRFAGLCSGVVESMRSEAFELRDEAKRLGEADFVVNMIGSVVGVVFVLVFSSVVWLVFRRHYRGRVGLRSEVVCGES